jgi:hypothetical protein
MALDEYMDEEIDNYLTDRMSEAERRAFEEEIASNPALKEEVAHQKLMMGAIIQFRKQELKEYIKQNTVEAEHRRNAGPFWMSIAAAFILAVGAGYYVYFKQQRGLDMKEMAVKTYPSPGLNNVIGPDSIKSGARERNDLTQNEKITGKTSTNQKLTVTNEANTPANAGIAKLPIENKSSDEDTSKINVSRNSYLSKPETIEGNNSKSEKKPDNYTVANRKNSLKQKNTEIHPDSIQGDVLLKDSEIYAENISTALDLQKNKNSNTTLNTTGNIKVSYWHSAINFKGYQYHKKQLSLYGVVPSANIQLRLYNSNLYLKMHNNIFLLKDDNYNYYNFSKPVDDKKLIDEIGFE